LPYRYIASHPPTLAPAADKRASLLFETADDLRYPESVNSRVSCRLVLALCSAATLAFTGCTSQVVSGAQTAAERQEQIATERQELEMIPPPSKNRFMAVRSYDGWQNPYITVQPGMLTLHVLLADANPVAYGAGGMLRPLNARRENVNIGPDKLGEAMRAIPPTSWPYGRVVAVEEAHKTPKAEEPVVRRNMEATVGTLNDLGIVAYDPTDGTVH
jgi:hypothetical protein